MSTNIIEAIQKQMGYKPLHKVSPNTQEPKDEHNPQMATQFEQAAIVSVVLGIYKKAKSLKDSTTWGIDSTKILSQVFEEDKDKVVATVANYAHVGTQKAEGEMHRAGVVALEVIHKETGSDGIEKVKAYLTDQRTNILLYLPPALHMGDLLHDTTVDDRTNKMEGPVSNFMHTIEKVFSSSK